MPPDTSKSEPTPSAGDSAVRDLDARLKPVFDAAFANHAHVVLAVSGGSDSMALLNLAANWRGQRLASPTPIAPPTLSVVTVDHGLRAGSAREAAAVGAAAAQLHLPHTTLTWEGPKPRHGIQATARRARYELIARHLAANGWQAVATAHTADDQAETLLMRLARGSGVDGLAAMRQVSTRSDGVVLLRPLLGLDKATLTDYLVNRKLAWSEDPSNRSLDFERVRIRRALTELAASDFALSAAALGRTAARTGRASDALNHVTARAWADSGGLARFDPLGYAVVDWRWLLDQPEEMRLRLLTRLTEAIGGQDEPLSQGQLERITVERAWGTPPAVTLHGTRWDHDRRGQLRITREWGRQPLPETMSRPDQAIIWDRRFIIRQDIEDRPARIGPLGASGLAELDAARIRRPEAPARVLCALPAVRHGSELVAVPLLGFTKPGFSEAFLCEPILPRFGPR